MLKALFFLLLSVSNILYGGYYRLENPYIFGFLSFVVFALFILVDDKKVAPKGNNK